MKVRKFLPFLFLCAFFLSSSQSVKAATPFSRLATRGFLLTTGAFLTNYFGYYLESKLGSSKISSHHKYGLMGGIGAAWLAANYCLLRAALANSYWHDPDIFKS